MRICNTTAWFLHSGAGISSIARRFCRIRSNKGLLVSCWNVQESSLMSQFYCSKLYFDSPVVLWSHFVAQCGIIDVWTRGFSVNVSCTCWLGASVLALGASQPGLSVVQRCFCTQTHSCTSIVPTLETSHSRVTRWNLFGKTKFVMCGCGTAVGSPFHVSLVTGFGVTSPGVGISCDLLDTGMVGRMFVICSGPYKL